MCEPLHLTACAIHPPAMIQSGFASSNSTTACPGATAVCGVSNVTANIPLRPEGVAALIGAILLFLLPGDRAAATGLRQRALSWRETRIDWDIVLLYGGGMALGELCFSTGLAAALGQSITTLIPAGDWSGTVLVAVAAVVAVVTSEFTSNTASANMVVPVVIALARATGNEPLPAALAATFAASLGFMMPVSTPCNALVYGSGRVPLKAMMASGAVIDVAGTLVVTAAMLIAGRVWTAP